MKKRVTIDKLFVLSLLLTKMSCRYTGVSRNLDRRTPPSVALYEYMSLSHAQPGIDATSMFLDTLARSVPKLIDV
jgi:hypothetical protein